MTPFRLYLPRALALIFWFGWTAPSHFNWCSLIGLLWISEYNCLSDALLLPFPSSHTNKSPCKSQGSAGCLYPLVFWGLWGYFVPYFCFNVVYGFLVLPSGFIVFRGWFGEIKKRFCGFSHALSFSGYGLRIPGKRCRILSRGVTWSDLCF